MSFTVYPLSHTHAPSLFFFCYTRILILIGVGLLFISITQSSMPPLRRSTFTFAFHQQKTKSKERGADGCKNAEREAKQRNHRSPPFPLSSQFRFVLNIEDKSRKALQFFAFYLKSSRHSCSTSVALHPSHLTTRQRGTMSNDLFSPSYSGTSLRRSEIIFNKKRGGSTERSYHTPRCVHLSIIPC